VRRVQATPDPTNTISIDKTNTADGEPARDDTTAEPGDSYTYNFLASCSSINVDCVNLTVVDTFPADVTVNVSTIPASIPGFRTVTWAPPTLTVVYVQPLANPPGATGKIAGTSDNFTVGVTLPANTTLATGAVIHNEATISADNVDDSATDPSDVTVNIPRGVGVETAKSFTDQSAIAGDPNATTTIHISAENRSSSSAQVNRMTIEDSTAATFEYLDFVSATVTQYPAGANQAQLFVCPSASAPCDSDADFVAGGTGSPPGPSTLALPPSVPAGDVVAVRVVFTAPNGSIIQPVGNGGTAGIDINLHLRQTVRSTGQSIEQIPTTTVIDNTATTTVTDPGADPSTATDSATAQYQILPPTLGLDISKSFFADGNGNYQTDSGEHAVIGENSGVSMLLNAKNTSAFPIAEIVITEPVAPNEFDKVNATSLRLTFPAGAANAHVVVTYSNGTTLDQNLAPPGPTTVDLGAPPPRVASIVVTFSGTGATIEPGATAQVGIHGNLNGNVDASDIPGPGTAAGVDNCAGFTGSGGGIPGTTGQFSGNGCAQLPVEARNAGTSGSKTSSQNEIPISQTVLFTMTTANNGNLPLLNLVVSDPPAGAGGVPPVTPVFQYGQFVNADVQPAAMASRVTIEVYTPAGGWQPLADVAQAQYPDVIGVRATIAALQPTESFDLRVFMTSRDPLPEGPPPATITNCYGVTASGNDYQAQQYCGPPINPAPVNEAGVINKFIVPESMPRRIPGMTPQNATVQLQVRNAGDITAGTLQITDNDADFWDAVDFVSLGTITPPAVGASDRADRIQVDAFVAGAWVEGTPGPIGSAALPAGVTAAEVRGLRFTFSDTSTVNDGFVLTPCDETACTGIIEFQVQPRLSLRSTGAPLPDELLDSASGAFTTRLHPDPADPVLIDEVTDNLLFVPGDPQLDVDKTPENTTVAPGQLATFNLVTTNNGTANLPNLTVSDPLPAGIGFDDTFADPDTGQPFTVTWTNLPAGYPAPPDAVFETTPDPSDPSRIGLLRWTFPGFDMPPNATVTIFFRYTLEPGVTAGEQITNTMGASSPVANLACTDPDPVVTNGAFGTGIYCTDPANVTVAAGASFASRLWVAGTPALGWYNQLTGELAPVGGSGCLSLQANGRTYTTNPCIALVNPGELFHYVLRVQNAGTEDALRMTVIDTFPAPGDTGVLGADRGTEWATAPTLAGPAVYNGKATGEIGYTSGTVCTDDLFLDGPPCPAGSWDDPPSVSTKALRLSAVFDPLPPGGTVDVYFSMTAPAVVPHVSDPTVAYNSIAHAEVTEPAPGQTRVLAPLEPLKVGVATMYGNLQVVKQIGENPGNVPVDGVTFTFAYNCTLTSGAPSASGEVTATSTTPGVVTEIPAGATCKVWETDTHGGVPSATEANPTVVVIKPSLTPDDPVLSSVTVTNDFPLTPPSPPPPSPPSPPSPPPPSPPPPSPPPPSPNVPGKTATIRVVKMWVGTRGTTTIFVDRNGSAPYDASTVADSNGDRASFAVPVSSRATVGEQSVPPGYAATINCGAGPRAYRGGPFKVDAPDRARSVLVCTIVNRMLKPQLVLAKRATKKTLHAGEPVNFVITVANRGRGLARNVNVCDRLPNTLVFLRARGARFDNGNACWHFPQLGPGRTRRMVARVTPLQAERRVKVTNVACVSRTTAPTGGAAVECRARAVVTVLPGQGGVAGVTG
jgi:uncharacterized repeat protein (TIGR01451 family)